MIVDCVCSAGIAIESFPTIYLFRKGAKATSENPSDVKSLYTVYEGERELGPFLEYMQVETGVTVSGSLALLCCAYPSLPLQHTKPRISWSCRRRLI